MRFIALLWANQILFALMIISLIQLVKVSILILVTDPLNKGESSVRKISPGDGRKNKLAAKIGGKISPRTVHIFFQTGIFMV